MIDKYEQMTRQEMVVLDNAERKIVNPALRREEPNTDALVDALELLDHLEDQKIKLEQREQIEEKSRLAERLSDGIANFSGSIIFVIIHILVFGSWILYNVKATELGMQAFDPFPFMFLTLAVSLEAIFLSSFILLSQNRQSSHDRARDEIDFERDRLDLKVDTLAAKTIREATLRIANIEKQLAGLHEKLDALGKKSSKRK
jgi:uncharacterized membrane protein